MNQLVESLARLYKDGKITSQKVDSLFFSKKINENEYRYILSVKEV